MALEKKSFFFLKQGLGTCEISTLLQLTLILTIAERSKITGYMMMPSD